MRQVALRCLLQNAIQYSTFLELGPHFLSSLPRATLKTYNKFKIAIAPPVKHRHRVENYHLHLSGPNRIGWVLTGGSQNRLKRLVLCWWLFAQLGEQGHHGSCCPWARGVQDPWGWACCFSPRLPPVPEQSSFKWHSALLCFLSAYIWAELTLIKGRTSFSRSGVPRVPGDLSISTIWTGSKLKLKTKLHLRLYASYKYTELWYYKLKRTTLAIFTQFSNDSLVHQIFQKFA